MCPSTSASSPSRGSQSAVTLDDVSFIAKVRDAEIAEPPDHPEWLVAVHGPAPESGIVVRSAGSWAAGSFRTAFGAGRSRTLLRVGTVDRVELSQTTHPHQTKQALDCPRGPEGSSAPASANHQPRRRIGTRNAHFSFFQFGPRSRSQTGVAAWATERQGRGRAMWFFSAEYLVAPSLAVGDDSGPEREKARK